MNPGLDLIGRKIGVYRVEKLIGAGGYSRVYRAVDPIIERQAAIKILFPSQGQAKYSTAEIQRFEREAKIVANLRDPRSVVLYEYGQTEDNLLYMIFEFIEGQTLEEVRRQQYALPTLRAIKILEQILLSLEEAHAMGLIHRDIKPANIMVFEHIGRTDQVKVLDFGVGKSIGAASDDHQLTQAGTLIGTPRYMAPEQWSSSGEVSAQTDIYSLGMVAYELLTGMRAITDTEPVHIMKAHLDEHPIELPADLDIPSGLRQVVNTMLQKPLDRRYKSVSEVLEDLTYLKAPSAPPAARGARAPRQTPMLGEPTVVLDAVATTPFKAVEPHLTPMVDKTSVTTALNDLNGKEVDDSEAGAAGAAELDSDDGRDSVASGEPIDHEDGEAPVAHEGSEEDSETDHEANGEDSEVGREASGEASEAAASAPPDLSISLNDPTSISELKQLQSFVDAEQTAQTRSLRMMWPAGLVGLIAFIIGGVAVMAFNSAPADRKPADPGAPKTVQPKAAPTPTEQADFLAIHPTQKAAPTLSPATAKQDNRERADASPMLGASSPRADTESGLSGVEPQPPSAPDIDGDAPEKPQEHPRADGSPKYPKTEAPDDEDPARSARPDAPSTPTTKTPSKSRARKSSRRPKLKIWGIE